MTAPLEVACRRPLINCWLGWCLSSAERWVELTGVEGGFKMGGVELQLGYFRSLRARVVSSAVWFVVDMLKVTIRVATGVMVEVATDGCLLGVLGAG